MCVKKYNIMKKKHREIVVEDVIYGWTVVSDGKERHLKIWKDKKVIHAVVLRTHSVTPKTVEEIIRDGNK